MISQFFSQSNRIYTFYSISKCYLFLRPIVMPIELSLIKNFKQKIFQISMPFQIVMLKMSHQALWFLCRFNWNDLNGNFGMALQSPRQFRELSHMTFVDSLSRRRWRLNLSKQHIILLLSEKSTKKQQYTPKNVRVCLFLKLLREIYRLFGFKSNNFRFYLLQLVNLKREKQIEFNFLDYIVL